MPKKLPELTDKDHVDLADCLSRTLPLWSGPVHVSAAGPFVLLTLGTCHRYSRTALAGHLLDTLELMAQEKGIAELVGKLLPALRGSKWPLYRIGLASSDN